MDLEEAQALGIIKADPSRTWDMTDPEYDLLMKIGVVQIIKDNLD